MHTQARAHKHTMLIVVMALFVGRRQLSVSSGRSDEESDFSLVRQMFANADEQNKGTMSRETVENIVVGIRYSFDYW